MSKSSTAVSQPQQNQASSTSAINGSSNPSASATPAPAINYAAAAARSSSNSNLPPRHSYSSSVSSVKGVQPPPATSSTSAPKSQPSKSNGANGVPTSSGSGTHSRKSSVSIRDAAGVGASKPVPQRQTSTVTPVEGTTSAATSSTEKSTMFGSIPAKPASGKPAPASGTHSPSLSLSTSTSTTEKKPAFDLHSLFQSGGSSPAQATTPASSAPLTTPPSVSGAPSPSVSHRKPPLSTFDSNPSRINHPQVQHGMPNPMQQPGLMPPQFPALSTQPPFHGAPPFYPNGPHPPGQAPQPMTPHPPMQHGLSTNARPWTPAAPHAQSPTTNGAPPNPFGGMPPATTAGFPQPPLSPTVPHMPGQPYSPSVQHPGVPPTMTTPTMTSPPSPFPPHAKPPNQSNQPQNQNGNRGAPNSPATSHRGAPGRAGPPTSPRMQPGAQGPPPPPGGVPPPQYWPGYQPYGVYQPYYPHPFPPPAPGPAGRPPNVPGGQPPSTPSMNWQPAPSPTPSTPSVASSPIVKQSFNASASEFRPSAPAFTPSSRPSKAILIKDPKTVGIVSKAGHSKSASLASSGIADDRAKDIVKGQTVKTDDVKAKEEADKKAKEEEEAAKLKEKEQEAAAAAKQAEEKKAREEEERLKKEAEEKRVREEAEAQEAKLREEELKKRKEAEEAAKEAELRAEEERKAKEAEEAKRKEEEEKQQKLQAEEASNQLNKTIQEATTATANDKEETDSASHIMESPKAEAAPLRGVASLPAKPVNGNSEEGNELRKKQRPGPLNLANTPKMGEGPAPLPSALATARNIEDLSAVVYPETIQSPRPELNPDPEAGKFRYDRDFLLQFMNVCKEKPDQLPSLEAIGMVDSDGSMPPPSRGSSFSMGGPPPLPRQPSGTIPQLPGGRYWRQGSTSSQSAMGMFQHAGDGKGDRFGSLGRTPSLSGMHGLPPHQMGRSSTLTRTTSSGQMGPGGIPASPTPNPSRRSNRGQGRKQAAPVAPPPGEYVAPLAHSADAWVPAIASKGQGRDAVEDPQSIEMVQRKVKSLLNKLTVERFDSISDQIIEWANKSEKESDGRILRQVIALVFEKATDEAAWSEMYARLCRKMIERISPNVVDEGIPEPNNRGGGLFRKYLLNRCQEDYERGWAQKEHTAAAAATKADEDKAKQAANEENKEAEVMSDEYYAAQKAKRQGLGLVRFIGELFKLQMLTERIMHECIKKLLSNIENPEEEDIESLCRFMTTVGKLIDTPKARDHMNIYFTRMKTLKENMKLSSRIRFMVQDVIDERDNGWKKRVEAAGPKSIAQIHQDAAKEKEEAAARTASTGKGLSRMSESLPRGGSRRGQNRDSSYGGVPQVGQDGWTSVGTVVPQRAMAGDLSGMGKVRETTLPISFGPTGVFTKGAKTGRGGKTGGDAPSRSVSITGGNRFDLLAAAAEPSATTVRRPSANESSASAPAIRQKLQLAPRTLPTTDPTKSEHGEESVVTTSERTPQVNQSIDNSVAEFFSVKDIQEGVANFTSLELQFRKFLVQAMADKALTSRQSDVDLYCKLLDELLKGGAVTGSTVKEGMKLLMPTLVDVAVDVPSAWKYTSQFFIAAGFSQEDVKELSELLESEDEDVDEAKTSLMDAFSKAKTQ